MRRSASTSPARAKKQHKMDDSLDLPEALTGTSAVPSYRPDAKERRYDRQLRLWASSGQRSLEQAKVLLVGDDATGSQALKNLVLPGIASFTVVSPRLATARDVATNFFLQPSSIGQPIASELVRHLCELNPAVRGAARQEGIDSLLQSNPDFILSSSLVILSNVDPTAERQLADMMWHASGSTKGRDVPLILVRNSGFIGRLEVQLHEHWVNDTHPDSTHTLRVDKPFPALENYARSLDLEAMDSMQHSHVPWVVLLVKAAIAWKDSHGGAAPRDIATSTGRSEQDEFKRLLSGMRRKADEENFDEAVGQAWQVWAESGLSSELQALLDDADDSLLNQNSKNIRILLAALRSYLEHHPLPPISPTLPDMHSSTESYIALQNLFRAQHQSDLEDYKSCLSTTLAAIDLPLDAIDDTEVAAFVKNINGVAVVKGSPILSRREVTGALKELCSDGFGLDDWPATLGVPLHVAFLAADHFYAAHGRFPGSGDSTDHGKDESLMIATCQHLLEAAGLPAADIPDEVFACIKEVVRGGASTLPTTAAMLGGLVAQEAIKLVTAQYAPLDNTCVVDLVHSTTSRFKL